MESILGSEDKKKVKKILRLNLSLVTVTNDKFFFFKMTCDFLFHGWMDMYGRKYAVSILIRYWIGLCGRYDYGTSTTMTWRSGVHAVSMVCGRCVFFKVWSVVCGPRCGGGCHGSVRHVSVGGESGLERRLCCMAHSMTATLLI